jgi:hypothetical protein
MKAGFEWSEYQRTLSLPGLIRQSSPNQARGRVDPRHEAGDDKAGSCNRVQGCAM